MKAFTGCAQPDERVSLPPAVQGEGPSAHGVERGTGPRRARELHRHVARGVRAVRTVVRHRDHHLVRAEEPTQGEVGACFALVEQGVLEVPVLIHAELEGRHDGEIHTGPPGPGAPRPEVVDVGPVDGVLLNQSSSMHERGL